MNRLDLRLVILLLGLSASAIILLALASQYIGGLVPCALCLQQRLPYYVGAPLALFAYWWAGHNRLSGRGLLAPLAVIFGLGSALAGYHAGVEYGWWAGPQSCGGTNATLGSTTDLLNALQTSKLVRCEDAAFTLFGVSMAGYNFIASVGLTGLALWGLSRPVDGDTK